MRFIIGKVTSSKMKNTCSVIVNRYKVHPKYSKKYRVSKKYLADTGGHEVKEGQEVTLLETRPLSKRKRWMVISSEYAQKLKAQNLAPTKEAAHDKKD